MTSKNRLFSDTAGCYLKIARCRGILPVIFKIVDSRRSGLYLPHRLKYFWKEGDLSKLHFCLILVSNEHIVLTLKDVAMKYSEITLIWFSKTQQTTKWSLSKVQPWNFLQLSNIWWNWLKSWAQGDNFWRWLFHKAAQVHGIFLA